MIRESEQPVLYFFGITVSHTELGHACPTHAPESPCLCPGKAGPPQLGPLYAPAGPRVQAFQAKATLTG